jgi:hypothetical protein
MTKVAAMLTDDFIITTAGWLAEPAGKEKWLAGLGQHNLDPHTFRLLAARTHGDVLVALAESDQQGTREGEPWNLTFRYTDVWVHDDGALKLAVRHASTVSAR